MASTFPLINTMYSARHLNPSKQCGNPDVELHLWYSTTRHIYTPEVPFDDCWGKHQNMTSLENPTQLLVNLASFRCSAVSCNKVKTEGDRRDMYEIAVGDVMGCVIQ